MIHIRTKMSLEEAEELLQCNIRTYRKKRRIYLYGVLGGLLCYGVMLFALIRLPEAFLPEVNGVMKYLIPAFIIGMIVLLLKDRFFKRKPLPPDKRYVTRVELLKIVPQIQEALAIRYLCCFSLEYTLKDDPNKIVECFRLDGYSYKQSREVERVTVDVDNFLILEPWTE